MDDDVIRTRYWTESELLTVGCQYYHRKKQMVLAARLPEALAPLEIHFPLETVTAEAGDVIVFDPGEQRESNLRSYDHWPVKLDIFLEAYGRWDEPWTPNDAQQHLLDHHCKPYYKQIGVWAKLLEKDTYIQSLESVDPQLVPAGFWVAIGSSGEPWHIEDDVFRSRYAVPDDE